MAICEQVARPDFGRGSQKHPFARGACFRAWTSEARKPQAKSSEGNGIVEDCEIQKVNDGAVSEGAIVTAQCDIFAATQKNNRPIKKAKDRKSVV